MFYLGMDVAKAKLDCCLLLDEAASRRKSKVVSNNKAGIAELLVWVAKQQVPSSELHVVMEGTGFTTSRPRWPWRMPGLRFPSSIRHK